MYYSRWKIVLGRFQSDTALARPPVRGVMSHAASLGRRPRRVYYSSL